MITQPLRNGLLTNSLSRPFRRFALGAMTATVLFHGIDFATSKQSAGGESGTTTSAPIVIAHRGASGYLVEHSEGAKVLAHAMGADYIEQDVVMTKDKQFIVTHDITMEETTNVEQVYPDRHRKDGKWYFADFTWDEIQSLSLHERTRKDGTTQAFPDRFPGGFGQRILRLEDEIKLIRGLDKTTNRKTGLYIELKGPSFHRKEFDVPMEEALMKLLNKLEVTPESNCYLQCFELDALKILKETYRCELPLIYLIGRPLDAQAIAALQGKVDGVGPSLELLAEKTTDGSVRSTGLVEQAHAAGLKVHPYTIRTEQQPKWSDSLEQTHKVLIEDLKVDGFFTDFPDLGRSAVLKAR
jgi:glycerophosphoryl diester phosphodiesterase